MNRVFLSLIVLLISSATTYSQNRPHRCGLDKQSNKWFMKTPEFDNNLFSGFESFSKSNSTGRNNLYVIPVHIIIVHPLGQAIGTGQNFSEDHIQSQIDVLNNDFARKNADSINTPNSFSVNPTGIRFCLATKDPDGNPTNGITRYAFNGDFDANELNIKQETRWDRDRYLNIWSAPNIEYLGYAYLPSQTSLPNPDLDGVVVNSSSFGGPGFGTFQPYHLGRTATHEVGHYLGLLHTWYEEGCSVDDGMSDTPIQDIENYGCPSHPSASCNNSGDMFMNYMDYVNDNCMNAFSTQQGLYMESILTGIRSSLLDTILSPCQIEEPLAMAVKKENVSCFGQNSGRLLLEAAGGSPPYSFLLNNELLNNTGIFDNLMAGIYEVRVTDSNNSFITSTQEITQPQPLVLIIENNATPTCHNSQNGLLKVKAQGGININPYQYRLVNNNEINSNGEFDNLPSGNYIIEVTDNNNCRVETAAFVSAPDIIKWQTEVFKPVDCFGNSTGKIEIKGSGGIGSLLYRINSGIFQVEPIFNNLKRGTYHLEIMDINGCLLKDSFFISEPPEITNTLTFNKNITCYGDQNAEITLNTSGGSAPFVYSLGGNQYQDSPEFKGLSAGNFFVIIKDSNNCQDTFAFFISSPTAIELKDLVKVLPECNSDNGKITVSASGGSGSNYLYRIGNFQYSNGEFNNVKQGNYNLIITDENGCSSSFQIILEENTDLSILVDSVKNVACTGENSGSIILKTSGGKVPLMYQINQKEYADGNFKNLGVGTYNLEVIDSVGCKKSIDISISEPERPLTVNIKEYSNGTGNGDGRIIVEASGGSLPYLYKLDENNSNSNGIFSDLVIGEYKIYVVDNNGCIDSIEFTISTSKDYFKAIQFKLYPNPVQDILTIESKERYKEIVIQNITGQNFIVENTQTEVQNGLFIESIPSRKLPSGWYLIKCTFMDNNVIYHSFIKL
jgi:hypothetical protein